MSKFKTIAFTRQLHSLKVSSGCKFWMQVSNCKLWMQVSDCKLWLRKNMI